MIQRIEHFRTKLQIQPFGDYKPLPDPQIQIPITRSFENIAPGTIASWRRYCESTSILEHRRSNHSRDFLQSNFWFSSDDIGTRLVRKVRRPDTATYAERLSGHERVNS